MHPDDGTSAAALQKSGLQSPGERKTPNFTAPFKLAASPSPAPFTSERFLNPPCHPPEEPKKGGDELSHFAILLLNMAKKPSTAEFKAQAQMFKALAHPGRLLMLDELSRGERCVCELAALVGSEMPTVSRHLSQLKHAGIVEDDKRGAQVFYRLVTPCVMNFFGCVESVIESQRREYMLR